MKELRPVRSVWRGPRAVGLPVRLRADPGLMSTRRARLRETPELACSRYLGIAVLRSNSCHLQDHGRLEQPQTQVDLACGGWNPLHILFERCRNMYTP